MQFNLRQILRELAEKEAIIFVDKGLKVVGDQNDFETIIELLQKNGYRRVRKEDLSVGTKLLLVRLCVDRVKRSPKQHSLGLHSIKITNFTPAAMKGIWWWLIKVNLKSWPKVWLTNHLSRAISARQRDFCFRTRPRLIWMNRAGLFCQ